MQRLVSTVTGQISIVICTFPLILTELHKDEEEMVTDGPTVPPSRTVSADVSHPYYDVARHGIIQVSGLFSIKSD